MGASARLSELDLTRSGRARSQPKTDAKGRVTGEAAKEYLCVPGTAGSKQTESHCWKHQQPGEHARHQAEGDRSNCAAGRAPSRNVTERYTAANAMPTT